MNNLMEEETNTRKGGGGMTHRILVIGGEATLRDKLAADFHEAGFAVAAVPDYTETLFEQNGFKPDLVIMDETLPSGDSMETCYQLRNIFDVPVVLLGNSSSKEGWRRVMQADADAYLAKPVRIRELIARVKALLRRYESQQVTDLQSRLKFFRSSAGSTQEEEKMSSEHELHRDDPFLLTSEDRANGFSVVGDKSHNITLLKQGRPMAWFAATVTEEVIVAFLKLIKDSERSDNKQAGTK